MVGHARSVRSGMEGGLSAPHPADTRTVGHMYGPCVTHFPLFRLPLFCTFGSGNKYTLRIVYHFCLRFTVLTQCVLYAFICPKLRIDPSELEPVLRICSSRIVCSTCTSNFRLPSFKISSYFCINILLIS